MKEPDALSLPKGWEVKKLGDVCEVIAGQSPKSQFYNEDEVGLPFYQGKKEFQEKYIGEPTKWTSKITQEAFEDDILMSVRAPVGPVNFATQKCCIGRGLAAIRSSKLIDKDYCFYYLQSKEDELIGNSGAVFNSINKTQIGNIPIPIPPLPEQKQIVAILDKAFAAIDQAQANIEKNIENAKELFQSKLNEIFSQKGKGWEEKSLGEVCENLDSKRIPITKSKRISGEIPYYGASGIVDYVADYLFDEDLLLVSEDGANLLARTYPIAFSISGKNWVNNHAHVLRLENLTSQIFIEYYLNSIKLDEYVSGMAQPKLNQRKLNSIKVPFPSIEDQEKTVSILKELEEFIFKIQSHYHKKLTNLENLKKSILQKAFSGELTQEATRAKWHKLNKYKV
jgi:type I restriction enzyme, S subunit